MSQGSKFRKAIEASAPQPLQIPGTINAYTALMAERVGHQAIYLSGGGVAGCRASCRHPCAEAKRRRRNTPPPRDALHYRCAHTEHWAGWQLASCMAARVTAARQRHRAGRSAPPQLWMSLS